MNRSFLSLLTFALALHGAGCVVGDAPNKSCDPNPCNEANRTTCVVEAGEARCLCDSGFISRPSGVCEPVGASNCAEHGGDSSEPDDCLARAQPLSNATRQQTIDPVGDYDFFQFNTDARNLYSFTVKGSGALLPRVDIFDQGGAWLTSGGEAPGENRFCFKARVGSPHFARISHSPRDPSVATGGYSLTFSSLGSDDHGDFAEDATRLTAEFFETATPSSYTGRFECPGDEDWFTFTASSSREYRLSFDGSRLVPAVAVYAGGNLRQPLFTDQNATVYFSVPAGGTAFVAIYSPQNSEGNYAFNFLYRDK
ncbi:MAG TPA: hypothetical protein VF815_00895 [Myxococcaceae bacterium]|jgi:hypothetical protein